MASPTNPTVSPRYTPAPYLLSSPIAFLTREQLIQYFEDFHASLEYASTAPHLIFERLISNLSVPVRAAIDEARRDGARTVSGDDKLPAGMPAAADPSPVLVHEEAVPATKHLIRSFHTKDGQWSNPPNQTCTKVYYTAGTPDTSRIALALTSFHLSKNNSVIVSALTTTRHTAGFRMQLTSLSEGFCGNLNSASCSWLELDASDSDMQSGAWNLTTSHPWNSPRESTVREITFPLPYDQPPQVLVWLKHLFLAQNFDHSLHILVSNITAVGFTLHVDSLLRYNLYGAEVTWLACSAGRPDVCFGSFHAQDGVQGETACEGNVVFESRRFKTAPRVIVGITGMHTDKARDVSIAVDAVEVTREGMKWRIDGMGHTDIASVEGSFVALA